MIIPSYFLSEDDLTWVASQSIAPGTTIWSHTMPSIPDNWLYSDYDYNVEELAGEYIAVTEIRKGELLILRNPEVSFNEGTLMDIKEAVAKHGPISAKQIGAPLGLTPREVRAHIQHIRLVSSNDEAFIVANHSGYWATNNQDEIQDFIDMQSALSGSINQTINAAKRFLR
jgi:hypothetical protein